MPWPNEPVNSHQNHGSLVSYPPVFSHPTSCAFVIPGLGLCRPGPAAPASPFNTQHGCSRSWPLPAANAPATAGQRIAVRFWSPARASRPQVPPPLQDLGTPSPPHLLPIPHSRQQLRLPVPTGSNRTARCFSPDWPRPVPAGPSPCLPHAQAQRLSGLDLHGPAFSQTLLLWPFLCRQRTVWLPRGPPPPPRWFRAPLR